MLGERRVLRSKENNITEVKGKQDTTTKRTALVDISKKYDENSEVPTTILQKIVEQEPTTLVKKLKIKEKEKLSFSPGIDKYDRGNTQAVTEYIKPIFEHFKQHEKKYLPSKDCMKKLEEVRETHRQVLFDWIVDIHVKYTMLPETLYLTINLIDRFLEKQDISKKKFQLLGISALMIAAKYEEIYPPKLSQYVKVCANAYTEDQVKDMEQLILTTLSWSLTVATPETFLSRFQKTAKADSQMKIFSNFLTEISLLHVESYKFLPSQIACASIYLSNQFLGYECWDYVMEYYTQYKAEEINDCVEYLKEKTLEYFQETSLSALKRKYESKKNLETYQNISDLLYLLKK